MSFLKKFGSVLLKGVSIASGLAPTIGGIVTTVAPSTTNAVSTATTDLTVIAGIIAQVEAMGQALGIKGPDKLRAAGPLVAQAIVSSTLLANKKIEKPDLFNAGAAKVADGIADILNSIHADSLKTVDKTE